MSGPAVPTMVVEQAAGSCTLQDLGRPAAAAHGLARSGAIDPAALRRAARLVGGHGGEVAVEVGPFGFSCRFDRPVLVAVTGAARTVRVAGREAGIEAPLHVPAGAAVTLGPARGGVYSYLAVGGGFSVAPVLGSGSCDTLSGIGPAPLGPGSVVAVGRPGAGPVAVDLAVPPPRDRRPRCVPGPHGDWFPPGTFERFCRTEWVVGGQLSRVGARLEGTPLPRLSRDELEPEPMIPGFVQVPPDGRPVVLLRDHGATGGYPVLACVLPDDVALVGQTPPGEVLRFRPAPQGPGRVDVVELP